LEIWNEHTYINGKEKIYIASEAKSLFMINEQSFGMKLNYVLFVSFRSTRVNVTFVRVYCILCWQLHFKNLVFIYLNKC